MNQNKPKKILFFFVHPSKYHLFKHTINHLKNIGYEIDIAIVTKDVLEDLIKNEGWEYTNIIPEGRRNEKFHPLLNIIYYAFLTLFKLWRLTSIKKYDLYLSDDLLSIIGKLRKIKCIHFQDDDITAVPESKYILKFADNIVSPECCDLSKYNYKKISYKGNHEMAYLHPKYFIPQKEYIVEFNHDCKNYSILRLVSLTATHDLGKKGISDIQARELIQLLEKMGEVFITSERELIPEFEKYRIIINPNHIAHALYFAEIFIGDSQTMTSEAAVLGTPSIRFNDFVGRISYLEEEEKYGLTYGFRTDQFDSLYKKVEELINNPNLKNEWEEKKETFLKEHIDVTEWMINLIEKELNI